MNLPGQVYASFVRSPYSHGVLKGVEVSAALAVNGVFGIYTGKELTEAGYGTLKCVFSFFVNKDGSPMIQPDRTPLATGKVRYVGDPIAVVVARTPELAREAAEAVVLDIDVLPAVTRPEEAVRAGAPVLYDEAPGNLALDYRFGDANAVGAAFRSAAHVTRLDIVNSRIVVNAMEPRAAIADYDRKNARYTLHAPQPGRIRHERPFGRSARREPGASASSDGSCRRLLRHEVGRLPRVRGAAACGQSARQASEVGGPALRELRLRPSWPGQLRHCRTGS